VLYFDLGKPDGYPRRAADTTRLRKLIGWVPNTQLEVTLAEMIADYRGRTGL
jgi:nucleoside-diphosphate-sugar epimerase